jgi:hypothetical protein
VKIFLSHPSEERDVAERLNLALVQRGHDVFFDRADLEPGREYDQAIANAIAESELFVFLITPGSVKPGRYTLTELKLAQERWPHPDGRVLPVMLRTTDYAVIPNYLRAVDILTPEGEPVAETVHEVQRLVRSHGLTTRTARRLRTPGGMAVAAVAVLAVIALGWRMWTGRDRRVAKPIALPAELRVRARQVVPMLDSGFIVSLTKPAQLQRFTEDGVPTGDPVDLPGDPVWMSRTPAQVLVVTRARDGILVLDAKKLRVSDSALVDPARIKPIYRSQNPPTRSADLQSAAVGPRGELWMTTSDRDGEPTIIRYHSADQTWDIPTFSADTAGFGPEANGVTLHDLRGMLWGVRARGYPSAIYHLVTFTRIDRFYGKDMKLVACAHDLGVTPSLNVLFLSCDNELQEVSVEGNQLRVVHVRPTLPPDRTPGTSSYDLMQVDSNNVVVALSTVASPNDVPVRARVAEIDSAGLVQPLLDVKDVAVTSLALTSRSVVAVVRRADGSSDVRVVPRRELR